MAKRQGKRAGNKREGDWQEISRGGVVRAEEEEGWSITNGCFYRNKTGRKECQESRWD